MVFFCPCKQNYFFRKLLKILSVLLLLIFFVIWIIGMRDIINKYALNKLEYLVTVIIDDCIYEAFDKYGYDFNSLTVINKDNDGRITSKIAFF